MLILIYANKTSIFHSLYKDNNINTNYAIKIYGVINIFLLSLYVLSNTKIKYFLNAHSLIFLRKKLIF